MDESKNKDDKMNDTQADALIAAVNKLAAAQERLAVAAEKSIEVAEAALKTQTKLITDMHDDVHNEFGGG